ncbi:hypothetical protein MCOR25_007345 [Pyricularia grisea]|uniref:Dienelactone hydrolase domain-containing protein n=1 Tax=Pyricularia grisea TaxID=148305 RepID=A0A6P8B3A1_PYRGI|nr:uncharacterized protein PgNI_07917 [Pyricularia grisea]KAI6358413.1 hypothetical protein MCOR25_007345 [Pyricularia grisea]TLD09173.1 hypothetical protein PgNI_07917 [Pyricularia grisea]
MASNPPAACCNIGVRHEGTPTGQMVMIENKWDAYLALPPEGKAHKDVVLLYLPDVLGVWQNSKLMADDFAAQGYTTLVVDTFNGDPVPLNISLTALEKFDFVSWRDFGTNHDNPHTQEAVDPIIEAAIKVLKNDHGAKRIGAVGYCFGAKYVVRHYKNGINVGFVAHPSDVTEEELDAIPGPLAIAAAETDSIFTSEKRHLSEELLKRSGKPYQINLYSGVLHGFAVRGNMSNKIERYAKEQAFVQAVTWFNTWLL